MEKPNKEDFKYRIRTGNDLRVSYKTNWKLFAKDLEEWTDKQLLIHSVVGQSEQLACKGKCDHGYNDEFGDELFCSIKEKTAN